MHKNYYCIAATFITIPIFMIIDLVGFIQDVYSVHENQGSISISVFSFNSSIDVEVNFTTFKLTAIEGIVYKSPFKLLCDLSKQIKL